MFGIGMAFGIPSSVFELPLYTLLDNSHEALNTICSTILDTKDHLILTVNMFLIFTRVIIQTSAVFNDEYVVVI